MSSASLVLGSVLVLVVGLATLTDLKRRIIPNKLTGPSAVLAVVIGTALDASGEPGRLLAGAAAGGFLLLAALAYPGGMGMGDVKLAGVMGLFLGSSVVPAMLIALLLGVVVGVAVMAGAGVQLGHKVALPFGPFLAFGSLVAVFYGQPMIHFYVHHFLR